MFRGPDRAYGLSLPITGLEGSNGSIHACRPLSPNISCLFQVTPFSVSNVLLPIGVLLFLKKKSPIVLLIWVKVISVKFEPQRVCDGLNKQYLNKVLFVQLVSTDRKYGGMNE